MITNPTTFPHTSTLWLPRFEALFSETVAAARSAIGGIFFGHLHSDSFRLIRGDDGVAAVAMLAPSVTPWVNGWAQADPQAIPNNPAVRQLEVSSVGGPRQRWAVSAYRQYMTNLTADNDGDRIVWTEEYASKSGLGLGDTSAAAYTALWQSLRVNVSRFDAYYKWNKVSFPPVACDAACRAGQICATGYTAASDIAACLRQNANGERG